MSLEKKQKYQQRHWALIEAIRFFGSRKLLRIALDIEKSRLRKWLNVISTNIPYEYCMMISYLTGIPIERLSPFRPKHNKIFTALQAKNQIIVQWPIDQIIVPHDLHDPCRTIDPWIIARASNAASSNAKGCSSPC